METLIDLFELQGRARPPVVEIPRSGARPHAAATSASIRPGEARLGEASSTEAAQASPRSPATGGVVDDASSRSLDVDIDLDDDDAPVVPSNGAPDRSSDRFPDRFPERSHRARLWSSED